jgi:peptidoglycan hydrolase-like protein with peptidoglycan-binding domain
LRTESLREQAGLSAKRISSTFFILLGVAVLAVGASLSLPAEAGKRKNTAKPVEAAIPDPEDGEPMTLVVSLSQQKVDVYRGMTLITSSKVSTGMRGYATKAGVFSILEKRRHHRSNLYSGAPMPWMNRITWSGTALHAGVVPGYPASHGCIRLPFSFAPKLFGITTVGDNVIVARDRPVPQLIEHATLFQPMTAPMPGMVKQEELPKRQSSNDVLPTAPAKTQGKVARADVSGSTTDVPSSLEAEAIGERPAPPKEDPAAIEDTHGHAFDPFAGAGAAEGRGDAGARGSAAKASGHALDEDNGPEPSLAKVTPIPAAPLAEAPAVPEIKPIPSAVLPAAAAIAASPAPKPVEAAVSPAAPVDAPKAATAEAKPESTPSATPTVANETARPAESEASLVAGTLPAPPAATAPAEQTLATSSPAGAEPASVFLPADDTPPSFAAAKLMAGTKEMAVLAAEPRSTAPLRILVTRRTQRDRIIGVQHIFAETGYLQPQQFDGTLGKATVTAIKAFQKANGMAETGALNEELAKKVYAVSGKGEPPAGHLYVRQEFGRVFDAPVSFKDPETPLGTHIFTAMKFAPGETSARWMALSLQGDDPAAALERLQISDELRQKISERLTPGSSLIIGDTAINTAGLAKGNDFVVWAKDTPAKITSASLDGDFTPAKPRKKKKARAVRRPFDYGNRYYSRTPAWSRGPGWPW